MEKTIRYFLLIMIITGTIFTYGCFHDDLFKEDVGTEVEDEVAVEVEGEDAKGETEVSDGGVAEDAEVAAEESVASPQPVEEDTPVVEVEVTTEVEASATVEESPAPEEPAAPVAVPEPEPAPTPAEQPAPVEQPAPAVEETQSIYQDGAFNAQGNYFNPNGAASISVSLTLDNDVVTSLTVTPHATDETSIKFQNAVRDGSSGLVVGKKLDEIGAFSKISTSSLTPNGFNQAMASIKASAKN